MAWLMANWETIVVAVLAVDRVLISIFPDSPILTQIKNALTPK